MAHPVNEYVYIVNAGTKTNLSNNGAKAVAAVGKGNNETFKLVAVEHAKGKGFLLVCEDQKEKPHIGATPQGETYVHSNKAGWEIWKVAATGHGTFTITALEHNKNLGAKADGTTYIGNAGGAVEEWTFVPLQGPLLVNENVFITNKATNQHLSNNGAKAVTSAGTSGHEVFKLIPTDHAKGKGYLLHVEDQKEKPNVGCTPQGETYVHSNKAGWEIWTVTPTGRGAFVITALEHGKRLGAKGDSTTYAGNAGGAAEEWFVTTAQLPLPVGVPVIITNKAVNKNLQNNGKGAAVHTNKLGWETHKLVATKHAKGDGFLIVCEDQKEKPNLGCTPQGEVYAHSNKAGWETWVIKPTGRGPFVITALEHGKNLGVKAGDAVYAGNAGGAAEEWVIVPK